MAEDDEPDGMDGIAGIDDIDDEEMDAWLEEWAAVDREAASYLAERIPGVRDDVDGDDAAWIARVAETIQPPEPPSNKVDWEGASAVAALQHTDWLALALLAQRLGPGELVEEEALLAEVNGLEDVEGEVEDPTGFLHVAGLALLYLFPQWRDLGVVDGEDRLTARGVWGLPRALHRNWARSGDDAGA